MQDAIQSMVVDDINSDIAKEVKGEKDKEQKEVMETSLQNADEVLQEWTKEPTSVYEGVDREIFSDGVAVTSLADNYGKSTNTSWADAFVGSGKLKATAIGLWAGAAVTAIMAAAIMPVAGKIAKNMIAKAVDTGYARGVAQMVKIDTVEKMQRIASLRQAGQNPLSVLSHENGLAEANVARKAMTAKTGSALRVMNGLRVGLCVFAILLCVADVIMTIITLSKYYDQDHDPIPHHMVDLTYDEDGESSYIAYKSVLDTDGKYGDVNGGGGRQWLALYATKDIDAGAPILAPDGDNNGLIVSHGEDGAKTPVDYSPLHYFGSPNAAQNLTFASGVNGWSYKDKKEGTYLYFKRDAYVWQSMLMEEEESLAKGTATVISGGNTALAMVLSGMVGLILGIAGAVLVRRRKLADIKK